MFHGAQLVLGKHLNVYSISSSGLEVTSLRKEPGILGIKIRVLLGKVKKKKSHF